MDSLLLQVSALLSSLLLIPSTVSPLQTPLSPNSTSITIQTIPTVTPNPTPTPTLTPTPTIRPTPIPTRIPTPTIQPITAGQLDVWFTDYSNKYSVDRQRLWNIGVCESNLRPAATNGNYGGMFQFSGQTWKSTRQQMGESTDPQLRFNAEEAIKTAAFLLSTRGHSPWPSCSQD